MLAAYAGLLSCIDPAKVIVPGNFDWLAAGALAGQAARAAAGGGRRITTALDRVELIGDALIALPAHGAGLTVITENADFGLLVQVLPGLQVLFYDRHPVA